MCIRRRWFTLRIGVLVTVLLVASATLARAQAPFDPLHYFDGEEPATTSIMQASDGDFYITAARGGDAGVGVIFKMNAAGVVTSLHSFAGGATDGANPYGSLLQAVDGNFYGTTSSGGSRNLGTVFRMTPDGSVALLHSFTAGAADGAHPKGGLIQATDGKFYGTTYGGGAADNGTVFSITPAGVAALLHDFTVTEVGHPHTALLQAADGLFYGVTPISIFRVSGSGVFTTLYDDSTLSYFRFAGPLFQTADATVFGRGEVESLPGEPLGRAAVLIRVSGIEGFSVARGRIGHPGIVTSLFQAADGAFYGLATGDGSSSQGGLFRLPAFAYINPPVPSPPPPTLQSVTWHDLDIGRLDALIEDADGAFYGTTAPEGSSHAASVFRTSASGVVDVLHTFVVAPPEGANPTALLQASDGDFYGTTAASGYANAGTLFRMTRAGATTVLHAFAGGAVDGASPSVLIQATDGNFYGTTTAGGTDNQGTVFTASATGTVTLLHSFQSGTSGASPSALIQGRDGEFYGTTLAGGAGAGGTVFRMAADGSMTVLHAFGVGSEGAGPGSLVQGPDGNFYGTNASACTGRVFRMAPDGTVTVLWTTSLSGVGPCLPFPGIILGRDGNLYGTTVGDGGGAFAARFYKVTLDGVVTIIRDFSAAPTRPGGTLMQAADGSFYGSADIPDLFPTRHEGIMRITPTGDFTVLRKSESRYNSAFFPIRLRTLVQATDGNLYGLVGPLFDSAGFASYGKERIFTSGSAFRLFPPAPPVEVTVAPTTAGQVRLSWAGVAGAIRYRVTRRNSAGVETVLGEVTATTFLDTTAVRGQRYSYTITTITSYGDSAASYVVAITAGRAIASDFDGDGLVDIAVFRPSNGTWYLTRSNNGTPLGIVWGNSTDITVPADYDGDGKTDVAVFRPSTGAWYVIPSTTTVPYGVVWGLADTPVPADYDGDGKTDLAVFRPSTGVWYVLNSSTGTASSVAWGSGADILVPGDYDGDGKTDVAVFRRSDGTWSVLKSSTGTPTEFAWGNGLDRPVAADYDGDGKTDIAVFRPSNGTWYVLNSSSGTPTGFVWGNGADIPVPGDYDGDGKADVAIFRPSTGAWYVRNSRTGALTGTAWGNAADVPILKR